MLSIPEIQAKIKAALPLGRVVPRHNEHGHFYEVIDGNDAIPPVYPSVTGKLAILKDESLINYKQNKALEYMFAHYSEFTDANIMEHIEIAKAVPQQNLIQASDVGTEIHDIRQLIFEKWMKDGIKPADFVALIPPGQDDIRIVSAIRALQKFVEDHDYTPIACELFVYSHKLKVAGTLDDLGMMRQVIRKPGQECDHQLLNGSGEKESAIIKSRNGKCTCMVCDYQYKYEFVLLDLKSSNALKDHYFQQVALYWKMFSALVGIKPERCIILQVSKEKGTYKIEDLKRPGKIAQYASYMMKVDEGIQFIKSLRRNNQKEIITL
jgi:hypothetical protein